MNLQTIALAYLKAGLCAIPCNKDKQPDLPEWTPFKERLPRPDEINYNKSTHIGIICGKVSGNLEVIDVDSKYDLTGKLNEEVLAAIPNYIISRCLVIQTRTGGLHIYYRCAEHIEGNKKLAWRTASDDEIEEAIKTKKKKPEKKALIETRGEGGYVIAYPSDGYTILQKNVIPDLTIQERDAVFDACRSFNQVPDSVPAIKAPHDHREYSGSGDSPWVAYNRDGAGHLLNEFRKQGFSIPFESKNRTYIRHPQATAKTSGNLLHDINSVYFFSPNVPGFDNETGYCLAESYARLHGIDLVNNWKELYDRLRSEGFGDPYQPRNGHSVNEAIKKEKESGTDNSKKEVKKNTNHVFLIPSIKANNKFSHVIIDDNGVAEYYESTSGGKISEPAKNRLGDIMGDGVWLKVKNEDLSVFDEDWIQKDTPDCCYLYYQNLTVAVTKDGYKTISRSRDQTIWKSLVLPRDFKETDEIHPVAELAQKCIVNYEDFQIGIGYLLHRYWFRNITKIVWACDHKPTAGHDGRRGKDLFTTLVQECRNLTSVKWKKGHNFWTGSITPDTSIVHFEDTSSYLISDDEIKKAISGSLNIEGKGRDIITRQFKDKPKFSASCQTMPADYADSSIRGRVWLVEFTNYLQTNPPKDILVYDDADKSPFDMWVINCIQKYFQNRNRMLGTPPITTDQMSEAMRIRYGGAFIEAVKLCKESLDQEGYCTLKEVQQATGIDERNGRGFEKFRHCFEQITKQKIERKRAMIHGERLYVFEYTEKQKEDTLVDENKLPF